MVRGSLFFCGPMGEKLFIEHNGGGGIDSLFHDYLFIYLFFKRERKKERRKGKERGQ